MIVAVGVVTGFNRQVHCSGMNEEQSDTGVIDIPMGQRLRRILPHQFIVVEDGLHSIEQISAVDFIGNQLPLTRLEIFRSE